MLPASSEGRSKMLPHMLQCTGPLSATKNYLIQNDNGAEVEKTCPITTLTLADLGPKL